MDVTPEDAPAGVVEPAPDIPVTQALAVLCEQVAALTQQQELQLAALQRLVALAEQAMARPALGGAGAALAGLLRGGRPPAGTVVG